MGYKPQPRQNTVPDLVTEGCGELSTLAEEMREWADNLENGNLGHTQKFDDVSACADELERIDEPSMPEGLGDVLAVAVHWTEMVQSRKGRSESRSVRRDNAVARLQAALDFLQESVEEEQEDSGLTDEQRSEVEQFVTELQDIIDTAESLDFPGIY